MGSTEGLQGMGNDVSILAWGQKGRCESHSQVTSHRWGQGSTEPSRAETGLCSALTTGLIKELSSSAQRRRRNKQLLARSHSSVSVQEDEDLNPQA